MADTEKNYPPEQADIQAAYFKTPAGEIYYQQYGSGTPLLLLHGYGGCIRNWQPFTGELAKRYRLVLVDLRGHGHSSSTEEPFTHRAAALDVMLLLEALGIERCSAMGMSTGGMVLLHLASAKPEIFGKLVLISATTHFPDQARAIMRRASMDTVPREVREMYLVCAERGELQVRKLIEDFNALGDNYDDMDFDQEKLSAVLAPTLIIHGERDNFFPVEIANNLNRWISGSELWLIAGGEHVPVFDLKFPFISRVLQFLERP